MDNETLFEKDVVCLYLDELPLSAPSGSFVVSRTFDLRLFVAENKQELVSAYLHNEKHYRRALVQLLLKAGLIVPADTKRPTWGVIKDMLGENNGKEGVSE